MPWVRLGTADVHSLAFASGDVQHLYFGHHGGVLESLDGGRTWARLGARADAMSLSVGDGATLYIAGHEVFEASRDGGRTWEAVPADLPNLDIHGFTRDPSDGQHMWAYLAAGGVYESADGGTSWRRVYDGHIPFLAAVRPADATELLGLDPTAGLVRSSDGGASWSVMSTPPSAPIVSLIATPDGRIVLLGAADGLYRSDDEGQTWQRILAVQLPLAIATSGDGMVVAAVTRRTEFYRSEDSGVTWPARELPRLHDVRFARAGVGAASRDAVARRGRHPLRRRPSANTMSRADGRGTRWLNPFVGVGDIRSNGTLDQAPHLTRGSRPAR